MRIGKSNFVENDGAPNQWTDRRAHGEVTLPISKESNLASPCSPASWRGQDVWSEAPCAHD